MSEKEIPLYYKKLICKLADCKTGDWVYNHDAELCYVEAPDTGAPFYSLHYDGIEMCCSGDTIVYPLTLRTRQLAEKMSEHRKRYDKANIMNPYFSCELEGEFDTLMGINDQSEDAQKQYDDFWKRLDDRLKELKGYAAKLHIEPRRI